MAFVSYAQNWEDVFLNRVFGGQGVGFYVDIGAYDPVVDSVTKVFYDRGWSGINVEPGDIFEDLAAARPRDVNLCMAVLDRTGAAIFYQNERAAGMSRVGEAGFDQAVKRTVPCDTLENIIRDYGAGRPVDFVKIDAEGAEHAIIASTDWRRFRPRLLLIEATIPMSNILANDHWEPLLVEGGYQRVYFDGINCFYVRDEDVAQLAPHFRLPVNVLDDAIAFNPIAERDLKYWREMAESGHREREQLWGELVEARKSLDQSRADCDTLSRLRDELQADRDNLRAEEIAARAARDEARYGLSEATSAYARDVQDRIRAEEAAREELARTEQARAELTQHVDQLGRQLQARIQSEEATREELARMEEARAELARQVDHLRGQFQDRIRAEEITREELARTEQARAELAQQVDHLGGQVQDRIRAEEATRKELAHAEQARAELAEQVAHLGGLVQDRIRAEEATRQELSRTEQARAELSQQVDHLGGQVQDRIRLEEATRQELARTEQARAELAQHADDLGGLVQELAGHVQRAQHLLRQSAVRDAALVRDRGELLRLASVAAGKWAARERSSHRNYLEAFRSRRRVKGHVDLMADGIVAGWVYAGPDAAQPCIVKAMVGDHVVGVATASDFRQDLTDAGIGDGRHAFRLSIRDQSFLRAVDKPVQLRIEAQTQPPFLLSVFHLPEGSIGAPLFDQTLPEPVPSESWSVPDIASARRMPSGGGRDPSSVPGRDSRRDEELARQATSLSPAARRALVELEHRA